MDRFAGKVVIVTGAGSGIGAATARRFLAEGAAVTLTGRRTERLMATAAGSDPARVLVCPGDIADGAAVAEMVAATVARFGRLDVLVNNAGTAPFGPFEQTAETDWRRVMAVNVEGVIHACRAALPHLTESGGSIVNVTSISGIGGDWGLSYYNASKAAVNNLTRALALEHGGRGVRVNAVAPGLTRTEMTGIVTETPAILERVLARNPMRRVGEPEDVAAVIAFLASVDAAFVNGAILPVDGGTNASNGQANMLG